jgi:hypothetical protein
MFESFLKAGREVLNEKSFKKMLESDDTLLSLMQKAEDAPEGAYEGVIDEMYQYVQKKGVPITKEEVQRLVEEVMPESEDRDGDTVHPEQQKPGYSDEEDLEIEEEEDRE